MHLVPSVNQPNNFDLHNAYCLTRSNSPESNNHYQTTTSGETFLQVRNSQVVGVGGEDTGLGLYTLKKIPNDTYVCAYAPSAALSQSHLDGDYVIQVQCHNKAVYVGGKQNPLERGLGVFCNDGTFPFSLVPGKFSRLVAHRVKV